MSLPLVSVIIPFYNCERFLQATIQSAIDQTWPAKEIILVNDGATDGSLAIAKSYEGDGIRVFSQENKGAAAARNYGLREAKGAYIQFLDGDDLLSADKLSTQLNLLLPNPGKIAVCNTIHFKDGTDPLSCSPSPHEESFLLDTAPVHFLINLWGGYADNGSMVTVHSWLCSRSIINEAGPWNESLTVDDDGEYFCRVLLSAQGVLKSKGYSYYRKHLHANNLSAGKTRKNLGSELKALTLRFNHIAERLHAIPSEQVHLEQAYLRSLHQYRLKVYPQYPDLLKQAQEEINSINADFSFVYHFPGKTGELLNRLLGWKATKIVQMTKHFLMNSRRR